MILKSLLIIHFTGWNWIFVCGSNQIERSSNSVVNVYSSQYSENVSGKLYTDLPSSKGMLHASLDYTTKMKLVLSNEKSTATLKNIIVSQNSIKKTDCISQTPVKTKIENSFNASISSVSISQTAHQRLKITRYTPILPQISSISAVEKRKKEETVRASRQASLILVAYILPGCIVFGLLCYLACRVTNIRNKRKIKKALFPKSDSSLEKVL